MEKRRGWGDGREGDGDGQLIKCEDNEANINLVTDHNASLAYAPGLELQHLIMSTIGAHRGQLDIYIYFLILYIPEACYNIPIIQSTFL